MNATEVLAQAVERHHPRLVMLCSFQKEESVLVDELVKLAPDVRIVTIDTGVLFPETLATWKAFEERFGVDIDIEDATGDWTGPANCCGERKVAALERALGGVDAWITGIRRDQAPTRANARKMEWDEKFSLWKANPLADWTAERVWQHIRAHGLPYNPLHDRSYPSIGCTYCTRPVQAGEDPRAGRWSGFAKTECGLHRA